MLRMNEAVDLEAFNSLGDGIIDQVKTFAKSDQASGIIDAIKGALGKKKEAAPAQPMYPPGYNPYLAPTTTGFNWLYVAVPAGVLVLGLGAWLMLRKKS